MCSVDRTSLIHKPSGYHVLSIFALLKVKHFTGLSGLKTAAVIQKHVETASLKGIVLHIHACLLATVQLQAHFYHPCQNPVQEAMKLDVDIFYSLHCQKGQLCLHIDYYSFLRYNPALAC